MGTVLLYFKKDDYVERELRTKDNMNLEVRKALIYYWDRKR